MDFSTGGWLIGGRPNGLLIRGGHLFLNYHFFFGQWWLINRGGIINPHLTTNKVNHHVSGGLDEFTTCDPQTVQLWAGDLNHVGQLNSLVWTRPYWAFDPWPEVNLWKFGIRPIRIWSSWSELLQLLRDTFEAHDTHIVPHCLQSLYRVRLSHIFCRMKASTGNQPPCCMSWTVLGRGFGIWTWLWSSTWRLRRPWPKMWRREKHGTYWRMRSGNLT